MEKTFVISNHSIVMVMITLIERWAFLELLVAAVLRRPSISIVVLSLFCVALVATPGMLIAPTLIKRTPSRHCLGHLSQRFFHMMGVRPTLGEGSSLLFHTFLKPHFKFSSLSLFFIFLLYSINHLLWGINDLTLIYNQWLNVLLLHCKHINLLFSSWYFCQSGAESVPPCPGCLQMLIYLSTHLEQLFVTLLLLQSLVVLDHSML